jgi:DNA repair protein RecO (recombination protein O)
VEWEAPGIVLAARPYGEGDALATVLTEEHGAYRGLAKGGLSRGKANLWQPGNLVQLRWVARLHDQLGSFTAELVHAGAALAMDDAMALAILSAACAVAEGALTDRESYPGVFAGLLRLIVGLGQGREALTDLVRWEMALLAELGYGLDLSSCALTGVADELVWVSPRTGHAVSAAAAGPWKERLLALPGFLVGTAPAGPLAWMEGLALTGHFLARDAFGLQHKPLPPARVRLAERAATVVDELAADR